MLIVLLDAKAARPPRCLRLRESGRKLRTAPIQRRDQPFRSRPECHQRCHLMVTPECKSGAARSRKSPIPASGDARQALAVSPPPSNGARTLPPKLGMVALSLSISGGCRVCPAGSALDRRSISIFSCQSTLPCPHYGGRAFRCGDHRSTGLRGLQPLCPRNLKAPHLPWWEGYGAWSTRYVRVRPLAGSHLLIQFEVASLAHDVHHTTDSAACYDQPGIVMS